MTALICGSVAYDNIMVFEDSFRHHILPDKIHILNVSFLVPRLRREFGGCAANIAYNLKLLGEDPLPMATVGHDFGPYRDWLRQWGIRTDHIRTLDDYYTAQAFITTDLDRNQITAFHPGAMNRSELNKVTDATGVTLGMVSPDGRTGMIEHAEQFAAAGIPFIFDPGQGMPMFNGEELRRFIDQSTWVTVNDYEWQLLKDRTGWDVEDVTSRVDALIVTRGSEGSSIYTASAEYEIPIVKPAAIEDPTGCGDAYRAGLVYGLLHKLDWETTGRIASLMGAIKIEQHGTQNHIFTRQQFEDRFKASFGRSL
ncbi:MAG TPA: carbohydrate kinase family protein [Actinotalea caeni]|uniref:carbohydrate kinase family protein n=1 Tax=Actinotalea caeni TaxID=1348467 RepID=UPI002B4B7B2F|nr:carbohydrate kinase family protein [Actinotalea caeni]HLV56562.1 carbohydrate kinase family protein [Actinotalea caeni]